MSLSKTPNKVGYSRREFSLIFQIYSQNVYSGVFKDFSFTEENGRYFISFREEAGKTPLITIEKKKLGPDRSLFVATSPGPKNTLIEIARSEKIEAFVRQVRAKVDSYKEAQTLKGENVSSMI